MVKPVIFQIVGYQDSGKTTTMTEVIRRLAAEGYNIATIKHHGHGGKPDIPDKKDSGLHVEAGALASLIEGDGRIIIQAEKQVWKLPEQIELISRLNPDAILIEGHKHKDYPKAVLIRKKEDLTLLKELTNIKLVFCRNADISILPKTDCPVFTRAEQAIAWIVSYIKTETGHMSE